MKKDKGRGKRFVICLVVYAMLIVPLVLALSKVFPKGFKSLVAQILIPIGIVVLFVVAFVIIEVVRKKGMVNVDVLKIKDLSFAYTKEKETIKKVSFSIEEGKYVSIIGHNGSGKSTIAKLILGLLDKKSGSIQIFDMELNEKTVGSIRQLVGIVFQNPDNQFIGATVRDDIAFGLENRQVPHADMDSIIDEFAKTVNMEEFLDKEPSSLSGGQKQRVAIAGVLAMHPKMIIFDEATAMLDPKGKEK